MLLTVISMWRNLQTVRKQRPSSQRLQVISLPIAASQCLKGQLSPCVIYEVQWAFLQVTRHFQQETHCVNMWSLCLKFAYFSAGGIVEEVAVISMVAHSNAWVAEGMKLEPLNPAAGFLQGQQDSPWNKDHSRTWGRDKMYFFNSWPAMYSQNQEAHLYFNFSHRWMSWSKWDCWN